VKLRVITNSELRVFRRCQKEHHLSYRLGIRPIEDAEAMRDRRVGTLMHLGLEVLWSGDSLDAALLAAAQGAVDAYEAAKVRVLLRGYEARWGAPGSDVVRVEREFRAPLVNPDTGAASRLAGRSTCCCVVAS
jgi:hypothetical protein